MAKKKNSNTTLWGILACVGTILLIFPMFLALFQFTVGTGSLSTTTQFGLFPDLSLVDAGTCVTLVSIFAIVALVLSILYAVLYVLEIAKITKTKLVFLRKIISILILAVFLIILISGIVFITSNSGTYAGFSAGIGFYFALIGCLATGIFGMLESIKK